MSVKGGPSVPTNFWDSVPTLIRFDIERPNLARYHVGKRQASNWSGLTATISFLIPWTFPVMTSQWSLQYLLQMQIQIRAC